MQTVTEEEKRHSVATKSFHQGIPSITVVVDGGWSERSHKHSYTAKSGVAVIFGSHTRKLLFMSEKRSVPCVLLRQTKALQYVAKDRCYHNWSADLSTLRT